MNTAGLKLSAREALESSLSFLGQFLQQHWLLVVIYIAVGISPAFIIGEQDVSDLDLSGKMQLGIVGMVNVIPALLMIYYAIRDALVKLDPSISLPNKSIALSLWQIFCINIISAIVGIPLLLLLVVPGIWWSTKATLSYADLLSTNDGAVGSIRKSHQLMNDKFWQSFGFLLATSSTVIFITTVAAVTLGFFLLIGGMLNALFHDGVGINKVMMLFRIMGPLLTVISSIVFYYYQAWLYVYLKQNSTVTVSVPIV